MLRTQKLAGEMTHQEILYSNNRFEEGQGKTGGGFNLVKGHTGSASDSPCCGSSKSLQEALARTYYLSPCTQSLKLCKPRHEAAAALFNCARSPCVSNSARQGRISTAYSPIILKCPVSAGCSLCKFMNDRGGRV
jgi:hypothetical protein